ncbi:kinase-like protein [Armillaria gallica]|uniref:Kinase-like protein n=1 Tax=Armillaria gallica TaxID=47427 RepID=A0A2H3DS00_ARMGA|nr:kinase-like protein [Armillaria gallica]
MKCLRALSKARNIVPSSFSSRDVTREGIIPVDGGGFAVSIHSYLGSIVFFLCITPWQDIWKGRLHGTQVCLKVLRIFERGDTRVKAIQYFCQEALVWRQLRHPNVLPFLGVSETLFAPSYCLISPWMANGNIISYLEVHPDHNRLTSLIQIAKGMRYLHSLDPPIVHADIRGANILVMDDLCCCLADFGLSLFAESQTLDNSSSRGSIRWLAPEYMDPNLLVEPYNTARDIYAYGCTAIEIFTGKPPFSDIKHEPCVVHEVTKGKRPPRPPLNVFPDDELWSLVTACLVTLSLSSQRPTAELILTILTKATLRKDYRQGEVSSPLDSNLILIETPEGGDDIDNSPSLAQCEESPEASVTQGEATPTRRSLSTQTTPSSGKRRQSSSPKEPLASPSTRSANPTLHTKSENSHPGPSLASENFCSPCEAR